MSNGQFLTSFAYTPLTEVLAFLFATGTIPLPSDRDSSHRQTVESPETKHLAGVV